MPGVMQVPEGGGVSPIQPTSKTPPPTATQPIPNDPTTELEALVAGTANGSMAAPPQEGEEAVGMRATTWFSPPKGVQELELLAAQSEGWRRSDVAYEVIPWADVPRGVQIINVLPVYSFTRGGDIKVRYTLNGSLERGSPNVPDSSCNTTPWWLVMFVLAWGQFKGYEIHTYDISNTYQSGLNICELPTPWANREVYFTPPAAAEVVGKCCKALKVCQGLIDAPAAWQHSLLRSHLEHQSPSIMPTLDPATYTTRDSELIITTHVDDCLVVAPHKLLDKHIKQVEEVLDLKAPTPLIKHGDLSCSLAS